ncbi:MAG: hypothetical protein EHM13_15495, partial [Acidobacteria bacterium]
REKGARERITANAFEEVSVDHLESIITFCERRGYEFVSLDQLQSVLRDGNRPQRKFICITFDDGYASTRELAYPVLKAHGVPFTAYIAPGLLDPSGLVWWYALEDLLLRHRVVRTEVDGVKYEVAARTTVEKEAAFFTVTDLLLHMDQRRVKPFLTRLFEQHGIDPRTYVRRYMLSWEQVDELAADPLVTIGAHTLDHPNLSRLSAEAVVHQMRQSRRILESRTGRPVCHFAYPFGDRGTTGPREHVLAARCGFHTAVTTTQGNVDAAYAGRLTALPRVDVAGTEGAGMSRFEFAMSGLRSGILRGARGAAAGWAPALPVEVGNASQSAQSARAR